MQGERGKRRQLRTISVWTWLIDMIYGRAKVGWRNSSITRQKVLGLPIIRAEDLLGNRVKVRTAKAVSVYKRHLVFYEYASHPCHAFLMRSALDIDTYAV
jgi:hypothetical protein